MRTRTLTGTSTSNSTDMGAFTQRIDTLENMVDHPSTGLLPDRVAVLEDVLDNPDTDLLVVPGTTVTATTKFAQVDTNISTLQVNVTDNNNLIADAVTNIGTLQVDVADNSNLIADNSNLIADNSNLIADANTDIGTLQNQLGTFVSTSDTNQEVQGVKHFSNNVLRLANNYRFERDSTTGDLTVSHNDSQIPFFHLKNAEDSSATPYVQMDADLKLKDESFLYLSDTGDTAVGEQNSNLLLDITNALFVRELTTDSNGDVVPQVVLEIAPDSGNQYVARLNGDRVATEEFVTSESTRILFKNVVIEGGVAGLTATRETVFRNAITIHAHPHTLNADYSLSEDTTNDNSFTVNCPSTFSKNITLSNNADLVDGSNNSLLPTVSAWTDVTLEAGLEAKGNSDRSDEVSYRTVDWGSQGKQVFLRGVIQKSGNPPTSFSATSHTHLFDLPQGVRPAHLLDVLCAAGTVTQSGTAAQAYVFIHTNNDGRVELFGEGSTDTSGSSADPVEYVSLNNISFWTT